MGRLVLRVRGIERGRQAGGVGDDDARRDLVLVHTGWAHWYLTAEPGPRAAVRAERRATGFVQSRDFVAWCWDHRIALLATDTFAVEVLAGPAS
ncbi:cyclase family protein [Streptomyces asiaticus]|uniref:cyclase family protein n=1 Tax=Streptomyces asiaticus TaxID=114695 RepID=UPI003820FC2B